MAHIIMAYVVMVCTMMAYVVMAYVVMACILMACIPMACIVMGYIVMACIVMAHIGMPYIVMALCSYGLFETVNRRAPFSDFFFDILTAWQFARRYLLHLAHTVRFGKQGAECGQAPHERSDDANAHSQASASASAWHHTVMAYIAMAPYSYGQHLSGIHSGGILQHCPRHRLRSAPSYI